MSDNSLRIFPLGDSAVTVEFGNTISPSINKKAIALADYFDSNKFSGYIESAPAYSSTSIFYDLIEVRKSFPVFTTAFDAVKHIIESTLDNLDISEKSTSRFIEIPVHFDARSSPDLDMVSKHNGLSPDEVIAMFIGKTYRVYMLGFLPGFTYMGEVNERIATPRKETPRTLVPKGSVGIAGKQTGIYSLECPGGWQIIGRTDVEMFTPDAELPSYLQAGDEIKFVVAK